MMVLSLVLDLVLCYFVWKRALETFSLRAGGILHSLGVQRAVPSPNSMVSAQ